MKAAAERAAIERWEAEGGRALPDSELPHARSGRGRGDRSRADGDAHTGLRDAILTHPTPAEGLNVLFANVPDAGDSPQVTTR